MDRPLAALRALLVVALLTPVLALVATGAQAPPAGATFPGVNGRIAYVGAGNIFTVAPDGSDTQQLTASFGSNTNPKFSPDGSKFLFESTSTGSEEIWVMDADGSDKLQLTSNGPPTDDRSPTWSPDGTKIAFASDRLANGIFRPYVMDANGSNAAILTTEALASGLVSLDWSPDGTKILIETALDIYTIDSSAATTDDTPVNVTNANTSNERHPSWSPDGATFVFSTDRDSGNDEIYRANADGSSPTRLTTSAAIDLEPSYSPDGTTILFSNNTPGGIQTMPAAGGPSTDLDGSGVSQAAPNQQPLTSLTISLDVVPDQAQDFHFVTTGAGLAAFDLDDDPGDGTLPSSTTVFGLVAGTYTLTQDAVAGFQVTDIVCASDAESPDLVNRTVSIALGLGEQLTCTFVVTQTGTVTIVQDSVPDDPADFEYSTIRFGPSATLDDDADGALPNQATFEFTPGEIPLVQQSIVAGLPLVSIGCSVPAAIDSSVRSAGVTLDAGDAVTCTFTNARQRSDALIASKAAGPFVGNNVYNARRDKAQPQVKNRDVAKRKSVTHHIKIQNDGPTTSTFSVLGNGGSTKFTVQYLSGASGGSSISGAVKAGTYQVTVAPGSSKSIRAKVTATAKATKGSSINTLVTATSPLDPTKKDTVRGRTRRI